LYYTDIVKTVQARLDDQTEKTLARLVRQLGMSSSTIVREGIRLFAASHPKKRKIVGLGQFPSGIGDLASNKKHLEGFGR